MILVALDGSRNAHAAGLHQAGDEGCWTAVLKVLPPNEGDLELAGITDIDAVPVNGVRQVRGEVLQKLMRRGFSSRRASRRAGFPNRSLRSLLKNGATLS